MLRVATIVLVVPLVWGLILPTASWGGEDAFDLPPPANSHTLKRRDLWSTYYYVYSADHAGDAGHNLLKKNGQSLGVTLAARHWCNAAVEGTVLVKGSPSPPRAFNYAGTLHNQVDCTGFFPSLSPRIGSTVYGELGADAKYGIGDHPKFRLVPFRSIAVDRSDPDFRLRQDGVIRRVVIYVPRLKGVTITTPDGTTRSHDGYLFAADTGGAIKGDHIDFFLGMSTKNPAPDLIQSHETRTFEARIVEDRQIQDALFALHNME